MKFIKRILVCISLLLCMTSLIACSSSKPSFEGKELTVYSGAGLKKPMGEIGKNFEKAHGVKVNYIYGGSSQLLSQLELSGKGDVFIVGSMNAYESAKKKNLVGECKKVAHHTPVIAVKKGNPKNIKSLDDLTKSGIKVILGDEKANAIGATTQKIIKKNALDAINKNVVAKTATINEIVTHISEGTADVGIVTRDSIFGNNSIDIIEIPKDKNIDQILPISSVLSTSDKELSDLFIDYVASNEGKSIFEKYGFAPVK